MALSGNKGEWSEIYTLFKLLADGKVHAGDANLKKMEAYYPIISILRRESRLFEYRPYMPQQMVVIDEEGKEFVRMPMSRFKEESSKLLAEITAGNDRAFEIPATESFMNEIGCKKLKAPSKDKADIHVVIHDFKTSMTPLLGFSIKSQLGSASTLLNAGVTTNITYKVVGTELTDWEIWEINNIKGHLPRMKAILDKGCSFVYYEVDNPTFKNNLLFLDSCMPQFIADCLLLDSMPNSISSIKDAVAVIAKRNPLNFTGSNVNAFYAHKMKVLLLDAALGMTPAREWIGRYDANGGYLVVRKDGEIVCYHFYCRNDVEDYLFNNTRFERASRKRYGFGLLYKNENGEAFIKLNLQIRFIK